MAEKPQIEEVLSSFVEIMSRLLIEQQQKHIADLELTFLQAQALRILRRGPLPTGQLAAELKISAPALTQLTDRLMRKELIERQTAAADRRSVMIALSAKGKRLVDQFRKRRGEIFSSALAAMKPVEQAEVVEALMKVIAALQRYEATR
ncbi:MAG TPA: MarR family transcriptional regulator [Pyrinomonadaceae bacterium]